jgi:hypothetical protein
MGHLSTVTKYRYNFWIKNMHVHIKQMFKFGLMLHQFKTHKNQKIRPIKRSEVVYTNKLNNIGQKRSQYKITGKNH